MKKTILMLAAATLLAAACQTEPQPVVNDPAEVVMTNILNRKSVRSYTGDTIPAKVMENFGPVGEKHTAVEFCGVERYQPL